MNKDSLFIGRRIQTIYFNFTKFVNCRVYRRADSGSEIFFENLKIELIDNKKDIKKIKTINFSITEYSEKIKEGKDLGAIDFYDETISGSSFLESKSFFSLVKSIEDSGREYLQELKIVVTVNKIDFDKIQIDGEMKYLGIKSFCIIFSMV